MPLPENKLLIWDKKRAELKDLECTQYNKITNTKVLSEEEKQQLVTLINRICNEEVKEREENNNEIDFFHNMKVYANYKITTKDNYDITMDNTEDIKLFLKLVE